MASQPAELGGSHCSANASSTIPSPQYGAAWQLSVHLPIPYGLDWLPLPRSQTSGPFVAPSPQYGASVQSLLHVP